MDLKWQPAFWNIGILFNRIFLFLDYPNCFSLIVNSINEEMEICKDHLSHTKDALQSPRLGIL